MKQQWIEVPVERFDEMLGVLPPEIMTGIGFLVGEPSDHVICSVSGRIAPNFQPFAQVGDKYYEGRYCMTIAEFKKVNAEEVVAEITA